MPALPDPSCYARARYPGHTVRARIWWSTPVGADERTPSKLCPVGHGGFTHANGHLLSPPRRPMLTFLISRRQPNEGPEFGWVSSTRGHLTGCSSGAFKFAPCCGPPALLLNTQPTRLLVAATANRTTVCTWPCGLFFVAMRNKCSLMLKNAAQKVRGQVITSVIHQW